MAKSTLADVTETGAFVRQASVFRNWIEDGGQYPPAAERYLLIVSYACPWASRCLAFRQAKGLEDAIGLCVVSPVWAKTRPGVDDHEGWVFDPSYPGATEDPLGGGTVRDLYDHAIRNRGEDPDSFSTRYTVPILFDTHTGTIVNNESSEIIRMFNDRFNAFAKHPTVDLAPMNLRDEIDVVNAENYESVCNGVYKCGFAQSQGAYDQAATALFARLDALDALLAQQRFLIKGHPHPTEADIRLFVTIIRFDEVYVVHFKCNRKTIRDYKHLYAWMKDVYHTLQLAPTVNMQHIKEHYYRSHRDINRYGIVPQGPFGVEYLTIHSHEDRKHLP